MRTIDISNYKGDVGKTTTAVNLAPTFAARGLRTPLVDLDPQASATDSFGLYDRAASEQRTSVELLYGGAPVEEVAYAAGEDLDVVASTIDLVDQNEMFLREQRLKFALDALGVHVADNSAKARRDDWVFSLAEEPSKKVSSERLGFVYGKEMLRRRFEREGAYRPTDASTARIREAAERALEPNDLAELSRPSSALETCAKFDVESIDEFGLRMATLEQRGQAGGEGYRRLEAARAYMAENSLMPLKTRYGDGGGRYGDDGNPREGRREDEQQRILAAERQQAQQDQRKERSRR